MRLEEGLLDLLVPPLARQDPRRRLRHRGITKSLFSISGVVSLLFLAYVLVRPNLTGLEAGLFVAGILSPVLGTLFVRFTSRIELGLLFTNLAGIGIVAFWCAFTGGILSVALPWFLPNLFLLSTFGSKRMLAMTAGLLLAVLGTLFFATTRHWLPPSFIPAPLVSTCAFLSVASSVALVVVAAFAVTVEREKSKRLLFEAKNAAETANQAKSAFLASMSHELRTPLHAVLLSADLLEEDQASPLNKRQARIVEQLRQGGELLLGLVNQVLELSSIEAGRSSLSIMETSLADAFSGALNIILPMARRRHIQVEFDLDSLSRLRALADPAQLNSVLINLLSNAVKYNRPEGQVAVNAWRTLDGRVRIEIRDTGPGIADHHREAAFQPFNRLGAEGSHIEGTGLGLAITERLVQMMSGTLGFVSIPDQGTTFWVELPTLQSSGESTEPDIPATVEAAGRASRPSETACRSLEILIVEDHPINQQLLQEVIENLGHRVTLVSHGAGALRALGDLRQAASRFDVVLMDLMMPVMDGLETTRRIRRMEEGTGLHLPIVGVTACAMDRDREACLEAGMDHYLAKPVRTNDLQRILDSLPPSPGKSGRGETEDFGLEGS